MIIIPLPLQLLITDFMDTYQDEFDYEEENKLCYMEIFHKYQHVVESFLLKQIHTTLGCFDLTDLFLELNHTTSPITTLQDQGEVIELIRSLTDFLIFKDLMLDHKTFRSGKYDSFNVLQINSIQKAK